MPKRPQIAEEKEAKRREHAKSGDASDGSSTLARADPGGLPNRGTNSFKVSNRAAKRRLACGIETVNRELRRRCSGSLRMYCLQSQYQVIGLKTYIDSEATLLIDPCQ